ncbi:UDP-N-acetylmuramate dehydrogenase [soil metagenome]
MMGPRITICGPILVFLNFLSVNTSLNIQENIPLSPLTTLGIGGNARYFVRAETEAEVADAVRFAAEKGLDLFILGGGSNVLISDRGFGGIVLQIAIKGIESAGLLSANLTVGAGEDWDAFVARCAGSDLAGVECLSGIPGYVGGTPVQNVGAYGQEVSETIVSVRCLDRETGEFVTFCNAECGFAYRTSIFNSTRPDKYIVLNVTYALRPGGEPKVVYKDLLEHFGGQTPSLVEVRDAVLKIRRAKSMVIDPADPNSKSAGSFFKNPIVETSKLDEIRCFCERVPYFEFGDKVKIPAAWLIENAGFSKGFILGNAGISSNHSLALINRGSATAAEFIELEETIQAAVLAKFGIELLPEPVFVGF